MDGSHGGQEDTGSQACPGGRLRGPGRAEKAKEEHLGKPRKAYRRGKTRTAVAAWSERERAGVSVPCAIFTWDAAGVADTRMN